MKTRRCFAFAAGFLLLTSVAAQPLLQPDARPAVIPFQLEGANIVINVELAPGRKLPFMFDSGLSNGNLVTPEVAKALGLKASAKQGVNDASGDHNAATLATAPSIRIGSASLSKQTFAIVAIPEQVTQRSGKPPLAGFIGAPLLENAVLCIDYEHQRMQRWARRDFDSRGLTSVPMTLNHGLPTIVVTIDGAKARLIVDSGNNGAVVVYPAFAAKHDFRKRYPDLVAHSGSDGSGQDFEVLNGEAKIVAISPEASFQLAPLTVMPQGMDPAWGIDGMVGFEVLSRLNPCLDRDGQRFLFRVE
ncbi:retropepsin-like aspartic protease [uncultured Nevskia sp.]|uniref:retropepsin-like aspartic protease n=1 Tax=uncultured Nevskia sp. TaxID=228950 RepID=UPI0025D620EA|nr:retropepsin-like aspartic protease [uncultured Nevskia sp.]